MTAAPRSTPLVPAHVFPSREAPAALRAGQVLRDIDLCRDVEAARVPTAVARRDKLVELRRVALAMVRDEGLLDARACWRLAALRGEPGEAGWLEFDGARLQAPWLVPSSGQLTGAACAVATLGDGIEQRVAALFGERRASLAVALDGVANELLWALSRRVQDRMLAAMRRHGLCVAGELRAGDPGLALKSQQVVLDLAGAHRIDVSLTTTLMMNPTKSTSIVQGVGLNLPVQAWSRCDSCRSRDRCALMKDAA